MRIKNSDIPSYLGDLSRQDAKVLVEFAAKANNIIEFGVGGSTHIIAQSLKPGAKFVSIDTDPSWIEKTKRRLSELGVEDKVTFMMYEDGIKYIKSLPNLSIDMVFDDGVDHLRVPFATAVWSKIVPGGHLLYHDTRRAGDIGNVCSHIKSFFNTVGRVDFNYRYSNITVVHREPYNPYENWNFVQGRRQWEIGYGNPPAGWQEMVSGHPDTCIVVTVTERPAYLKELVRTLAKCHGINNVAVSFFVEPDSPKALSICKQAPFRYKNVVQNKARRGVTENPRYALRRASEEYENIIYLESDLLVSPSLISVSEAFFSSAINGQKDTDMALVFYSYEQKYVPEKNHLLKRMVRFAPLGWAARHEFVKEITGSPWTGPNSTDPWDLAITNYIKANKIQTLSTVNNFTKHIGREGHNASGDWNKVNGFDTAEYCTDTYLGPFEVIE